MKTMKMNFKYVMMAAAFSMGFASCSNDNGDEVVPPVNANEHNVKVKINVGAATRAEEASAIDKTPTLSDITLFFVDEDNNKVTMVHKVDDPTEITSTGELVEDIPGGSNTIYAIGNLSKVASLTIADIVIGSTEDNLKDAFINVEGQLSASGTPSYEHVNLYGHDTYIVPSDGTSAIVSLEICPAISRLEIAKIEANQSPIVAADKITSFTLNGIFINNTYKEIGVDPINYGEAGNALGYPGDDEIWTTNISDYPDAFCNYFGSVLTGGNDYSPTGKWAYYVAPAAKQVDGKYVGEAIGGVQYDAKPVIVVKVSDVITVGGPYTGSNPAYITVTKLKEGSTYLDHFERGNVYDITSIAFDASNLTEEPMTPPEHDVTIDVTVKPWEGVTTTPEL